MADNAIIVRRRRRQMSLGQWGLGLLLAVFAATGDSAEQAVQAIAQLRSLQASGQIKPGATLRLRVKQGNMASFLGAESELQREWERRTGIPIDIIAMPQVDSLEYIRAARDIDLTIARNHEYPDLFDQVLIEDLTPLYRRFGFPLPGTAGSDYLAPEQQAYYAGRVVAVPADNDVAMLFLRRDLLESAEHRKAFRAHFGRELGVPETWREYQDLIAYFHNPSAGFFGALEPREKLTGWFYWMPRFAAFAGGKAALFDREMRPLINSPAGISATESYVAAVGFSPPEILGDGKDYSYTVPIFLRGNGFATIVTPAGAKIANRSSSAIRGKFTVVPMPGHRGKGDVVQRKTLLIYGNNLVIPRSAPNKEIAFLFSQWFTDPDVSAKSVAVAGGFQDPYRSSHLQDPAIQSLYTPDVLNQLPVDLRSLMPSGTGLPGDSEYLAVLNENLWQAAQGRLSPQDAMKNTARRWNEITDRLGRDRQIRHLQAISRSGS